MAIIESEADILNGLDFLAAADPRLARMIPLAGSVPLRRSPPGFASLASIIIAQQVSRQSADAIEGRLLAQVHPFTPERFLECGEDAWRIAGLSRPKQRTLCAIAEAVRDGTLDLEHLCTLPAPDAQASLTAVRGIGPWTAEVYLMFAAGHPDIFPAGDVALQAAAAHALNLDSRPSDKELRIIAESWTPWRAVAARLFWAYYAKVMNRGVMP